MRNVACHFIIVYLSAEICAYFIIMFLNIYYFIFRKTSSKKGKTSILEDNPTISVEEVDDDQEPDEEGYQSDEESSEEDEDFSERRELYVNGNTTL